MGMFLKALRSLSYKQFDKIYRAVLQEKTQREIAERHRDLLKLRSFKRQIKFYKEKYVQ